MSEFQGIWVFVNVWRTHMTSAHWLGYFSNEEGDNNQGPLLLTWFNFNPSMDK